MSKAKTYEFKAETRKVLNILTHSLYTNREIFLRELLSNASDALDKLRFMQNKGESVRDPSMPLEIRVRTDKDLGILEISDTGIGMTEKEMIDNLGTIAKSGSEQFAREIEKEAATGEQTEPAGKSAKKSDSSEESTPEAEDKSDADEVVLREDDAPNLSASQIIGRFGVGFYSVFMVADKVEVVSVSALGEELPHAWTSDGDGSFSTRTLEGKEAESMKRGTCIRVFMKESAKEFLEKYKLESTIRRYSNFLPFPIYLDGEQVNTTPALWREPKFSITREQYDEFFKYLTYDDKPPLDVIHLTVDAPVQFTALMFIPGSSQDLFNERKDEWGLDLYVRRVLIERNNSELIPNHLAFLKGVVDTEDLPLNIARETLQENIVIRKISQTIVKQVLTHLERLAASDKEKYVQFWKLHGKYFKFAFNDYLNRERVAPLMRFTSSGTPAADLISLDDYLSRAKAEQKEIWYVTAPTAEAAKVNPHLERFRRKGIEVLYLLEAVDEFALESLAEYKGHPFKSVEQADSKALDAFSDLSAALDKPEALSEDDKKTFDDLVGKMKEILGDQVTDIRVTDRLTGSPAVLVSPDGVSSSMEKLIRVMQKSDSVPKKLLEINPDHSLMRAMLRIFKNDPDNSLFVEVVKNLFDSVLLLDGYFNDPYVMADRTIRLMDEAATRYADLRQL